MKCEKAEKLILLQDSGEMSEKLAGDLGAHLHDCDPCRQFQHALHNTSTLYAVQEEPPVKIMQDVLRATRMGAPTRKTILLSGLRPIIGVTASLMIGIGLFLAAMRPDTVGMELVMSEKQLLPADDQIVSVMYSGLSEDDLAFNFLMTFEEG